MRTAALPAAVAMTSGLRCRVSMVWASCVPTSAARPMVLERCSDPGVQRPICQAMVAPAAVVAPRLRSRAPLSGRMGTADSGSGNSDGREAQQCEGEGRNAAG